MDNEMLGFYTLGEGPVDTMTKEEALEVIGSYRELVNKGCDRAVKELDALPGDTLPWSNAMLFIMSCIYASATEGGSDD